ncbi:SH3 domain-containing protein [Luteimonas kalidii]|uniref:SH3 domain-containing protein n=1 Tax=Luteimonas kalidii TaxID=3042025 RepID=UPI003CE57F39
MAKGAGTSGGEAVSIIIALTSVLWLLGRCSGDTSRSHQDATSAANYAQPSALSTPAWLAPRLETAYVDADALNYRGSPSGRVLGRLTRGTQVTIEQREGGWMKVSAGSFRSGWISERYTCATAYCWHRASPAAAPAPATMRAARAAPVGDGGICPCSGSSNCFGPRGGRYCITSGGNKRYR